MAKSRQKPRSKAPRATKVRAAGAASAQTAYWDRLSPVTQHAVIVALLFAVGLGFFSPLTFGNWTLIGGDTVQWRGMAQAMFEFEEATGNRALWAPNGFGGMPGYLIHFPKEVLQGDAIPAFLRGLGLWPVAHFLVLLLGAYALAYFLTRDAFAGGLAAVAYGLTTYIPIILAAGHNTKFVAMAYSPWLVLAFMFAVRQPPGAGLSRNVMASLLFAVALAVNLRADHVQITYYVVFVLGIVWLVEAVSAVRTGTWKAFALATGMLAVGGVLGMLMVAQPYMAVAEYREFTIRAAADGGLDWHYATRWSQGFGELVTLLIPHAYGGEGMTYWGPKPFTAGPHYLGPVVLLLAGLAAFGVKRSIVLGLVIAAFVMVLLSLGEHFPLLYRPMFEYFPFFSSFRVPETWLATVAMVVALLAGIGLYFLARREGAQQAVERKTRHVYVALAIIGGFLLLTLLGRDVLFSFEAQDEIAQMTSVVAAQSGLSQDDPQVQQAAASFLGEIRAERREMFTRDNLRAILFIVLAGALIVMHRLRRIPTLVLQVGLVLLVVIDLWQVDRRYFDTDHPALRTPTQVQRLIPEYGVDRFIQTQVNVAGGSGHFRTFPLAMNPFNDGRSPYYFESLGGYHGAKLAVYQDYIDHLIFREDGSLHTTGLDLMSTRFVIARQRIPGMALAFEDRDAGLVVMERPDVMPRAWFVDRVEVVPDEAEILERLQRPGLDLRQSALVMEQPEGLGASSPGGDASIELIRHTPREIVWSVETDRARFFVASEVYYPAGWQALIDRDEVPIYRTNHLLRGVVVPEGRHLLSMRFDPPVYRRSVMITMLATVVVYFGLFLLLGMAWYRRGEST